MPKKFQVPASSKSDVGASPSKKVRPSAMVVEKTAMRALHKRGYRFRKLRAKMILTPDDIKTRYAWAKKYRLKSRTWWLRNVHIHLGFRTCRDLGRRS